MITKIEAMHKVLGERIEQDRKWGFPQNNTPFEWMSILIEEVGELATSINNAFIGKNPHGCVDSVLHEAIQVSAVALAIIEHYGEDNHQAKLKGDN